LASSDHKPILLEVAFQLFLVHWVKPIPNTFSNYSNEESYCCLLAKFISEWETPTWPPSIQMGVTAGIFLASILLKEMRYLVYIRCLWSETLSPSVTKPFILCQKLIILLIYTANISIGDIKILLMIKYCVLHEIMLFSVSALAFVVLLPDCQFLITCINCGCVHVHKGWIWCEIYILAHHNAELIYIDKHKTRETWVEEAHLHVTIMCPVLTSPI
jgi:hypothetical protein